MDDSQTGYLRFINHHVPTLESGVYTLEIAPSIAVEDTAAIDLQEGKLHSELVIEGPRFQLDPQLVRSVYPAANAIGAYENVFPHVIFNRSTLLWERRIEPAVPNDGTSWMALLLFDVAEVHEGPGDPATPKVRLSVKTVGDLPEKLRRDLEISQQPGDAVLVMEAPRALLGRAMPRNLENLRLLSHIRHPSDTRDETLAGADEADIFPILVGSRLPKPDSRSIVYLVSLEGHGDLFDDAGELRFREPAPAATEAAPAGEVEQFVVLYSWSFTAQGDSGKFHEAFEKLARNAASLHPRVVNNPSADAFLREGYVPLEHQTRTGNRLASFYRSCLIPMPGGSPPAFTALDTRAADELLRLHPTYRLYDVTYAAAWELGRLLTLQNARVALDLYRWKRSYRHRQRATSEATAQTAARDHLPAGRPIVEMAIPASVVQWFTELARYDHIPFNYLVPSADMLPAGSLRAFYFDETWQTHFLSGAFSVGHVAGGDRDNEAQRAILDAAISAARRDCRFGILIRSSAVSDFPHVRVEGVAGDGQVVAPFREAQLGADILFLAFGQPLQSVSFAQAPEAIHFGLLRETKPDRYLKKAALSIGSYNTQGREFSITDANLDAAYRNVDFVAVAAAALGSGPATPAGDAGPTGVAHQRKFQPQTALKAYEVALLMLEAAPKVRIALAGGAS